MEALRYIVNFTDRWLGSLSHVMVTFFGVLICVLVVGALWDKRLKVPGAILGIATGLAVAFSPYLFNLFTLLSPNQTVRLSVGALAFIIMAFTIRALNQDLLLKRYALIWTVVSLSLFGISINPSILLAMKQVFNSDLLVYLAIGGFLFLVVLNFHFTISLTRLQHRYKDLADRQSSFERSPGDGQELERPSQDIRPLPVEVDSSPTHKSSIFTEETLGRTIRGTRLGAPIVIALAVIAVLITGLTAPQAMVGDEVTHFYMLHTQSKDLSKPNFVAEIPVGIDGDVTEIREYPHSFFWHYVGAIIYKISGGSFVLLQIYHSLFLLQLLTVAYLLALSRKGAETRSALLYILVLASLPLCLMFSVVFYQDIPMVAQVLTAFYLLTRRRWLLSSVFMALAIGFKVTAILFLPAYFLLLLYWQIKECGWGTGFISLISSMIVVAVTIYGLAIAINNYSGSTFYPQRQLVNLALKVKNIVGIRSVSKESHERQKTNTDNGQQITVSEKIAKVAAKNNQKKRLPVIANHPGDLRVKGNFLIYGGLVLYIVLLLSFLSILFSRDQTAKFSFEETPPNYWLWAVGGSYILLTYMLLRTAPDARFFLPGLVFILLPICERVVILPKPKVIISLVAALAFLQGGYVLAKTYNLRIVPGEIEEAIEFLTENPPTPSKIFMYPEGNYRLFPVPHEWYFRHRLREFWRGSDDKRIKMLHDHGVGAIVIKKHLVGQVDNEITDLGVYPLYFVQQIQRDRRLDQVFDNGLISIYFVPQSNTDYHLE